MIDRTRLVAPREHLGVLLEPPVSAWGLPPAAGDGQHATRPIDDLPILDTTVHALREGLLAALNVTAPVVATGHQAEFFHAGVLAKLIVVDLLAGQTRGSAPPVGSSVGGGAAGKQPPAPGPATNLFVLVDSDTPRGDRMCVPRRGPQGLERSFVPIPGCELRWPLEWHPRRPPEVWREFWRQVSSVWVLSEQSALPAFVHGWLSNPGTPHDEGLDFCEALAGGVGEVERVLGLRPARPVRVSALSRTAAFRAYLGHLVLRAAELARCYNAAQQAYRERHRVRSPLRPVPPLLVDDQRVELPLWIGRAGQPRRRLYVGRDGPTVTFYADRELAGSLPRESLERSADSTAPWPLEQQGWHIRPRALTLSLFLRLFVADVFLHGIGGAKYDEVTDELVRGFFGRQPPPLGCVSATLYAPLPHAAASEEEIRRTRRALRDLRYNPQRYVERLPGDLLAQREQLIRRADALHRQGVRSPERRSVWAALRELNGRLAARGAAQEARLRETLQRLEAARREQLIAQDRELFFALHPLESLRALTARLRDALRGPDAGPQPPGQAK